MGHKEVCSMLSRKMCFRDVFLLAAASMFVIFRPHADRSEPARAAECGKLSSCEVQAPKLAVYSLSSKGYIGTCK